MITNDKRHGDREAFPAGRAVSSKTNEQVSAGQALRQRAEATLREKAALSPEDLEAASPEARLQVLHELRVHQIELEMQNEELRQAQLELDAARARYFDLYDLAPVGYCIVGETGLILQANLTAATLLGMARGALAKQPISRFIHRDDQDVYYLLRKQLTATGESQVCELRMLKMNGTSLWAHLAATAAQDAEGAPVCRVVISDITERKRVEAARALLQAKLRESQKMEALGTLAGGVAHDFNNVLATIMGNVELARQDLGPGHQALESLQEIRKAGERAKHLVDQILAFGRRQVLERKLISLAPVVEESARLLRSTLPTGVSLKVACAPDAPAVLADAMHIEQLLVNLCSNAWQAMKGQDSPGIIEVRLEACDLAAGTARDAQATHAYAELRPGRYTCLTVRDNGAGMDEGTQAHLFEPFFTTKPVDEGTGLGLAVVHGIAQEHKASIRVHSKSGEGSAFRIYFPAATEAALSVPAQSSQSLGERDAAPPVLHGGDNQVLYVDDDEAIVFLMTRLLKRKGYRVSGYTDPAEALAAARADPGQFDLVVTDYNMPQMSGLEFARALRQIHADLPIIMASGYITEALRAEAPAAGVSELVSKPNTVDELCEAVERFAKARRGEKNAT